MEPTHPFFHINLGHLNDDFSRYMKKVEELDYDLEDIFYSLCDLYYLDPALMNLLGAENNPAELVNIIEKEVEAANGGYLIQ